MQWSPLTRLDIKVNTFFCFFLPIMRFYIYLYCREKCIISRQNIIIIMTKSIESKILMKSKKCGRGSVFFVGDFIAYGNRDAVNKALERLVIIEKFILQ